MKRAYLFPGQGSQFVGMADGLWDAYPDLVERANDVLGYSVPRLCLDDPSGMLDETQFTQPALYVASVLHYRREVEANGPPDVVAGHSLGEYNALHVAGVFDFETGLRVVQKRGAVMGRVTGGGMAAVLGLSADAVRDVLASHDLDGLELANDNAPGQVVLSGRADQVEAAESIFNATNCEAYVPLRVSGAFHSSLMDDAQDTFAAYLDDVSFGPPTIPVVSNVEARPYAPDRIVETLARQMTNPVRWTETVRYMMGRGVDTYVETGPGDTLTKLVDRIRAECTPLDVSQPSGDAGPRRASDGASVDGASVAASTSSRAPSDAQTSDADVTAETLGSDAFKRMHGTKYAYMSGAMYKGIASPELVVRMATAGFMSSLGTGGLTLDEIEEALRFIQSNTDGAPFAANLLCNLDDPELENQTVELYLKHDVRTVEASAYMQVTEPLIRYRATGLRRTDDGGVHAPNRIIAKVSRPEVAEAFMRPAPDRIVDRLVRDGRITEREAELVREIPVARDVTVEADSGGHTDKGNAYVLMPAMLQLRDDVVCEEGYDESIRVGAAGGIGTPQSATAALMLGADYLVTGSINQCTVESGMSDAVKDLLQDVNVQDTAYAPAGDMFEIGAQVQVLKKGVFFPVRANKLYDLYQRYDALDEIPSKTRERIEETYFQRSFDAVWEETRAYYAENRPDVLEKAEKNPKQKMALLFRWYFVHSTRLALEGDAENQVDFQVHTGPSLGAFNQWVSGTELDDWTNRHVDDIARRLLKATARTLSQRYDAVHGASTASPVSAHAA